MEKQNKQDPQDVKNKHTEEKLVTIIQKIDSLHSQTPLKKAIQEFKQLKKEWEKLISSNAEKYKDLINRYVKVCDTFYQQRDWALWANYKKKDEICSQLTDLLEQPSHQGSIDQFSELRSEWKNTGPVPDRKRNDLWKKYRILCKQLYEKNLTFYQGKQREKEENLKIKTTLCREIEALVEPDNWSEASQFVIKIQKGWNAIGPVPKENSKDLWERFQKACNTFFDKRNQFYSDLKKKQQENLEKKKALYDRIEILKNSTNWKETSAEIQHIQKEWHAIGGGPQKKEKALWEKFRAACDFFFNAQQDYFNCLEKEKPENLKKKEKLCIIVESLEKIPENEQYQTIVDAQEKWKQIGPVSKDMEEIIWKRFRKPIDEYFRKRNNQKEKRKKNKEQNKALKEKLCKEAESMCHSTDWWKTAEKYKGLQKKWKQIGPAEQMHEQTLWHRFHAACDAFFERYKEQRGAIEKEKEINLEKKVDLCFQAEIIADINLTKEEEEERAKWQLKKLTENFWYKILDEKTEKWEDKAQKIIELQKQWKEIGPVPSSMHEKIWKRFQKACNYFFEYRRKKDKT